MRVEQAQATIEQLVTQELDKFDLKDKPVKFRYWYGETSMNALVAVPEIADLDDEELENRIRRSDDVQPVKTGLNIREIESSEKDWLEAEELFRDYVLYEFDGFWSLPLCLEWHVDSDGVVTIGVHRFDVLRLEECDEIRAYAWDLEEFITGLQSIYGDFDPEVVQTIVSDYDTLLGEESIDYPETEGEGVMLR